MLKALIIALLASTATANTIPPRTLSVVTILQSPYVIWDNGFSGFLIDLMNEVADKLGVQYSLYLSPNGFYGVYNGSAWNGMIAELINGRADLALADLTVTEPRKRAVDFSAPYLHLHLNAIVSKDVRINSMDELARQTSVPYGSLVSGSTHHYFETSDNATLRQMAEFMKRTNSSTRSYAEGIERAKQGNYAFIGESAAIEWQAVNNCGLKAIGGWDDLTYRNYAIGLQKNSEWTAQVSDAIRQLETNGDIARLYKKWWRGSCN